MGMMLEAFSSRWASNHDRLLDDSFGGDEEVVAYFIDLVSRAFARCLVEGSTGSATQRNGAKDASFDVEGLFSVMTRREQRAS